jgi:hypothetical protein
MDADLGTAYLDVTQFDPVGEFHGASLAEDVLRLVRPSVEEGSSRRLLSEGKAVTSFGFTVSPVTETKDQLKRMAAAGLDRLVWFAGGWGAEAPKYIANAARKMPEAAAQCKDSLTLYQYGHRFPNPVPSADGTGRFPMGSFPYGGAKFTRVGNLWVLVGVSVLSMVEDDAYAGFIGALVITRMNALDPTVLGLPED